MSNSNVPILAIPYEYKWKKPGRFLYATNYFEDNTPTLERNKKKQ
ncbi:MAG: hypothetical protein ABI594_17415 [Ginsengibacter sp.]